MSFLILVGLFFTYSGNTLQKILYQYKGEINIFYMRLAFGDPYDTSYLKLLPLLKSVSSGVLRFINIPKSALKDYDTLLQALKDYTTQYDNNPNLIYTILMSSIDNIKKSYFSRKSRFTNSNKKKYGSLIRKIKELPLGKNIWLLMSHGISTGEVFKTKIPIIFETSLGAPSKYHPTRSKFFEDDILKSIFSISDLKSIFGNDIRIYREGDIVPDLTLDYFMTQNRVDLNSAREGKHQSVRKSGIVHLEDYLETRNNHNNTATEAVAQYNITNSFFGYQLVKINNQPRLDYHL